MKSTVTARELVHRVTIQEKTIVRDDMGGHVETWNALAGMPVWAKVHNLSGRELFNAKGAGSSSTVVISVRNRADLKADMRVLLPGNILARIESIPFYTFQDVIIDMHCVIIDG